MDDDVRARIDEFSPDVDEACRQRAEDLGIASPTPLVMGVDRPLEADNLFFVFCFRRFKLKMNGDNLRQYLERKRCADRSALEGKQIFSLGGLSHLCEVRFGR